MVTETFSAKVSRERGRFVFTVGRVDITVSLSQTGRIAKRLKLKEGDTAFITIDKPHQGKGKPKYIG